MENKFSLFAGIGDILTSKSQLLNLQDKVDKIYISVDEDLIQRYRYHKTKEYIDFCRAFLKNLFTEQLFQVDNYCGYPQRSVEDFCHIAGRPQIVNMQEQLCLPGYTNIYGDYIVLNTKVRDYNVNKLPLHQILKIIKETKEKYNLKLIVMGEKELQRTGEYSLPHNMVKIYSIYDDIKSLFNNDFIDLTVDKLGIEVPDLNKIKLDCSIMANSKLSLFIGWGGSLALSLYSYAKTLTIYDKSDMYTLLELGKEAVNKSSTSFAVCDLMEYQNKINEILSS